MAQTGRVVLRTSRTKTALLLVAALCFVAPLVAVLPTRPPNGGFWVALVGAVFFGAGACVAAHRLARPEQVVIEPLGLRWGPHAIPWERVAEVDRSASPKHYLVFVRLTDVGAPLLLPQNLSGSTRDQVRLLQEVHARSRGHHPRP